MKNFIKIITMTIAILTCLTIFSGCNVNYNDLTDVFSSNNTNSKISDKSNITSSVSDLIDSINVSEPYETEYDRDKYTSSYQHYTNYLGDEFTSIRKYAFYSSINYDPDTDIYTDPYDCNNYSLKETDYDHIIPLHYVNQHGGDNWSDDKKKEYADDPTVGVDVNAHDNRAKGDKGPSEWLPSENVDDYCYTWLVVANKYNISISQEDMNVIISEINNSTDGLKLINEYR